MPAVVMKDAAMEAAAARHEPVMVDRVTELLAVPAGEGVLIDATVGAAGHAAALLGASGEGVHLVGFDRDPEALSLAGRRLTAYGERVHLVQAGFAELADHVRPLLADVGPVRGILYDLGVSSMQLDQPERGFSFRAEGPLDMRMDPEHGPTAAELLNASDREDLADLIRRYGEERYANRIARAIVAARPLATTSELAEVVAAAVPAKARHTGIHPATRTFQALRIAVNDELDHFSASLPQALELASPAAGDEARGGRIAVLSYHSLEDRLAKQAFREAATGCVCPPDLPVCACGHEPTVRWLTRGVERPDPAEQQRNPRARSAKLRVVEKIASEG